MQSTQGLSPDELRFQNAIFFGHEGDEPDADEKDDEKDGSGDASGGAAESGKKDGGDPQKKIAAQQEEIQRHVDLRKEAERERDDLKKWREEQERKTRTDEENREADLKAAAERAESLASTNHALVIENAFLKLGMDWVDVGDALALANLAEVKVDEKTGKLSNPDALEAAAKDLAKKKPWLVQAAKQDEDSGDETSTPPPASGQPPAGKKKVPANDPSYLRNKYPALRR